MILKIHLFSISVVFFFSSFAKCGVIISTLRYVKYGGLTPSQNYRKDQTVILNDNISFKN